MAMEGSGAPARLLVVEDESIVAMDLADQLESMGYEVCGTADNGQDAIALTAVRQPQLVLMDIVIKGAMDGVETARHIAHRFNAPVIFLTAYSDARTVERAARTAPYGYVTKPFQPKELRAAIEVALVKSGLERRLRESEQWFASTLRCVGDCVIATDRDGYVKFLNPAAERLLGWHLDQALGRPVEQVMPLFDPLSGAAVESPSRRALRENAVVGIRFGSLVQAQDGRRIPIDDSCAPIRGDADESIGTVIALRDVSARVAMESALRSSEERFRSAFDFAPMGMALVGLDGKFLQVNAALCRLLGRTASELLGLDQLQLTHADDVAAEQEQLRALAARGAAAAQFEKRYRGSAGGPLWCLVSVSLLSQEQQALCYLYQVYDMTERKQAEFQLSRLAHYDMLTGLVNRARLMEEADFHLRTARRSGSRMAFVFMDLDRFKPVNDTYGHEAGDQLLKEVAQRLKACVRESDCVARLGGDEFVLLLPAITAAEDVSRVVQKVMAALAVPVTLEAATVTVGASLGASLYPDDGQEVRELLKAADSALYHAKALGRNNLQFHRKELTERVDRKRLLDAQLCRAIEHGEFELHYQPWRDLRSGGTGGIEALLRWRHPDRGLLEPADFLDYCKESGLIVPIGQWALRTACGAAATWEGDAGVAVNVSARQLTSGDFIGMLRQALRDTGLAPSRLCLEIAEPALSKEPEAMLDLARAIRAVGVRVGIDDFGTGPASLGILGSLQPDYLKIDGSLIGRLPGDTRASALVRAALAMARGLGIKVIGEGVETRAQLDILAGEGFDAAQGRWIAVPCAVQALDPGAIAGRG